jgi:rhodanese-related sulfurtransferase
MVRLWKSNQNIQQRQNMKRLSAVLATVALAASVFAGEFQDISIKEVNALTKSKKAVIIDVNGTESYNKGHVPGALDYDAIKDELAAKLPSDKNALVVAYCGGPKCMAYQAAAKAATKLGYKNVKHMSAGISGWKEAGQKLEK